MEAVERCRTPRRKLDVCAARALSATWPLADVEAEVGARF